MEEKNKKKMEFSKKLCIFVGAIMVVAVVASIVLSILDKDVISEVTVAVVTTCGGYLCSYGIKSAFEKNSRNKYGVDASGFPFRMRSRYESYFTDYGDANFENDDSFGGDDNYG